LRGVHDGLRQKNHAFDLHSQRHETGAPLWKMPSLRDLR
jgi:hypothetical protein